jgi:hypothetical protein
MAAQQRLALSLILKDRGDIPLLAGRKQVVLQSTGTAADGGAVHVVVAWNQQQVLTGEARRQARP